MSGFYRGDKVLICCDEYPEGTVGIIIDRVADFVYNLKMSNNCTSWEEEFLDHQLKPYEEPEWRKLLNDSFRN